MTGDESKGLFPTMIAHERPVIAIVGRPNVGKSTLFNRLTGSRLAITDDLSGVTRDRIFATVEWSGKRFTLVDTGGYLRNSEDVIERAVRDQVEIAVSEADVIIQVCDVQIGVTDLDREVSERLRKLPHPKLLIANKSDSLESEARIDDLYSLGLGDPFPVSAATGRRSGDLLDAILALFPELDLVGEDSEDVVRITLAGRPNVGKSSIGNRLLKSTRLIVSDVPGTTRDSVELDLD